VTVLIAETVICSERLRRTGKVFDRSHTSAEIGDQQ
jgi:hypothetical protein